MTNSEQLSYETTKLIRLFESKADISQIASVRHPVHGEAEIFHASDREIQIFKYELVIHQSRSLQYESFLHMVLDGWRAR